MRVGGRNEFRLDHQLHNNSSQLILGSARKHFFAQIFMKWPNKVRQMVVRMWNLARVPSHNLLNLCKTHLGIFNVHKTTGVGIWVIWLNVRGMTRTLMHRPECETPTRQFRAGLRKTQARQPKDVCTSPGYPASPCSNLPAL